MTNSRANNYHIPSSLEKISGISLSFNISVSSLCARDARFVMCVTIYNYWLKIPTQSAVKSVCVCVCVCEGVSVCEGVCVCVCVCVKCEGVSV